MPIHSFFLCDGLQNINCLWGIAVGIHMSVLATLFFLCVCVQVNSLPYPPALSMRAVQKHKVQITRTATHLMQGGGTKRKKDYSPMFVSQSRHCLLSDIHPSKAPIYSCHPCSVPRQTFNINIIFFNVQCPSSVRVLLDHLSLPCGHL